LLREQRIGDLLLHLGPRKSRCDSRTDVAHCVLHSGKAAAVVRGTWAPLRWGSKSGPPKNSLFLPHRLGSPRGGRNVPAVAVGGPRANPGPLRGLYLLAV
jgi:hypothetical protein